MISHRGKRKGAVFNLHVNLLGEASGLLARAKASRTGSRASGRWTRPEMPGVRVS